MALPNSGFQPDLRPNDVLTGTTSSYVYNFSAEGIRKFNGDGTVKSYAFNTNAAEKN